MNNDCTIQICDFGLARSMDGIYRHEVEESEPAVAETSGAELGVQAQNSFNSNVSGLNS